jgi:hypothetical protein
VELVPPPRERPPVDTPPETPPVPPADALPALAVLTSVPPLAPAAPPLVRDGSGEAELPELLQATPEQAKLHTNALALLRTVIVSSEYQSGP